MDLEKRVAALEKQRLNYPIDPYSQQVLTTFLNSYLPIRLIYKRFKHTDLGGSGTSKDTDIFVLPANCEILTAWFSIETAFAHTSTYTLSMGKDGDEDGLQTAQDAKTTGLKLVVGTDFTTNRAIYSSTAATKIQTKASVGSGNVSDSTAGVVVFHALYLCHPK